MELAREGQGDGTAAGCDAAEPGPGDGETCAAVGHRCVGTCVLVSILPGVRDYGEEKLMGGSLQYENRKAEYFNAIWDVINWKAAEGRFRA